MDTSHAIESHYFQTSMSSVTLSSSTNQSRSYPSSPNTSSASKSKEQYAEEKRLRRLVRNREAAKRYFLLFNKLEIDSRKRNGSLVYKSLIQKSEKSIRISKIGFQCYKSNYRIFKSCSCRLDTSLLISLLFDVETRSINKNYQAFFESFCE